MYVFSLITGVFLTCSNTTPTITIFVSFLFDKVVSMVKHIMEIVKGNTEFIKACQTPRTWRDQPFHAIPKQLQWQFLESLGEDKFVMQLGALGLHIKDNFLCF